ncbi:MAG: FAD:protein FMN transferase [Gemmatimonadaceae bacterium]
MQIPRSLRSLGMTVTLALAAVRLEAQTRHEFRELHMGVEVRIVLYAPDDSAARGAARAAFSRIAELEDIMSDYRPESELRRIERRPSEWVKVSEELFQVLARAVEVADATDGAFDPTVGPLVALWREARRLNRLPAARALDSARAVVGWRRVALDTAGRRVRLAVPGMRLDLGGIAKGDIIQRAADGLRARGVASSLIEAGGDIVVGEPPPTHRGWPIAAQDSVMVLSNAAISTSGPSIQFVEIDGTRYSHIVDPRTGLGLTSARHATVIAAHGALADALATALTLLSSEARRVLLARYPTVRAMTSDD